MPWTGFLPIVGARLAYGDAVRRTADSLIEAHGEQAGAEAWRAARLPTLTRDEARFCHDVAVAISVRLGQLPSDCRPAADRTA